MDYSLEAAAEVAVAPALHHRVETAVILICLEKSDGENRLSFPI